MSLGSSSIQAKNVVPPSIHGVSGKYEGIAFEISELEPEVESEYGGPLVRSEKGVPTKHRAVLDLVWRPTSLLGEFR